jgi:hypothetical protein
MADDDGEYLLLKWGNLKGWNIQTEASRLAFNAYIESGDNASAPMAMVHLDEAEKRALCGLIDAIDGPITNDWSGEAMTKDEAKKYVLEYGRKAVA